jgi:hypothetical protein
VRRPRSRTAISFPANHDAPLCLLSKSGVLDTLVLGRSVRRVRFTARPMEYRGVRYTIRARIERGEWSVTIYPGDVEGPEKVITGDRGEAELLALSMIDKWLAKHRAHEH